MEVCNSYLNYSKFIIPIFKILFKEFNAEILTICYFPTLNISFYKYVSVDTTVIMLLNPDCMLYKIFVVQILWPIRVCYIFMLLD